MSATRSSRLGACAAALAAVAATGCSWGLVGPNHPLVLSPAGARVALRVLGEEADRTGELYAADSIGVTIRGARLVRVAWSHVQALDVAGFAAAHDVLWGGGPRVAPEQRRRLAAVSRFPQGLEGELLGAVLARIGQPSRDEIPAGGAGLARTDAAAGAPAPARAFGPTTSRLAARRERTSVELSAGQQLMADKVPYSARFPFGAFAAVRFRSAGPAGFRVWVNATRRIINSTDGWFVTVGVSPEMQAQLAPRTSVTLAAGLGYSLRRAPDPYGGSFEEEQLAADFGLALRHRSLVVEHHMLVIGGDMRPLTTIGLRLQLGRE